MRVARGLVGWMRIVLDVGRKAARACTRTRTRLGYLGKLSLARSLACRRKVDNVTRVPIVIKPARRSIARARVCLGFMESLSCSPQAPTRSLLAMRRDAVRRSVEGLFGVETITPYTCSGLMVREYYIRIWNTPDNKGGESTVVLWLLALVWEISAGDGEWGMRERRSRLCHLSCALESLELNEPIHYVVQYLIIEKMASRRVASTSSIYLVVSRDSLQ